MIDPKELRMGNWVKDERGNVGIVKRVRALTLVMDHGSIWRLSDCSGIPLTSEWLERFGFKTTATGYYQFSDYDIYPFEYYDHWEISVGIGSSFVVSIQHVHQVQNLYFALTGTELTIQKTVNP